MTGAGFNASEIGPGVETERRLALFELGYQPLPLVPSPGAQLTGDNALSSKAVTLKDWTGLRYNGDEVVDVIRRWGMYEGWFGRNEDSAGWPVRSQTTGIRFPTAIDLDFDHEHIEPILDALAVDPALCRSLGSDWLYRCPIRTGGGQKLCIIANRARTVETGKIVGSSWASPDSLSTVGHVEIFHGQGQIGASGVHTYHVEMARQEGFFTVSPVFTPAIVYDYLEGPTPFETPLSALPELKWVDILRIKDIIEAAVAELGWDRLEIKSGGRSGAVSYTLRTDDDMVFKTQLYGALTYGELDVGMRLNMGNIDGSDSTTEDRGIVYETKRNSGGEQLLGIYDFKTDVRYLPTNAKPPSDRERRRKAIDTVNNAVASMCGASPPPTPMERRKPKHLREGATETSRNDKPKKGDDR